MAATAPQQLPDLVVTGDVREMLALTIDLALTGAELAEHTSGDPQPLIGRADLLLRVRAQLLDASTTTLAPAPASQGPSLFAVTEPTPELTRPQESAMDRIASEYGRCAVEHLADGAVVITSLLDDIEMRTYCIEPDGRERWRR